ncbi:rRNA maturation RNase YbeY [Cohnella terricola]|uniref:Endoribonuclease YbeY n=1 Tax=Cohnella terricola TaxID=1289167 RepID=A0A559JKY8_9BACL|nr:rRNA maturation RNase YbeY [Cohnella terricola]TVY00538.1 rRNA maturation RNase YbeY [Cohnella terricola]
MTLSLEWIDEREGGAGEREEKWMDLLEKLLRVAGEKEDVKRGIVTLTLTDDEGIRELNRQYRGLDKPTDVLSFSMIEGEQADIHYEDEYESSEEGADDWRDEDQAGDPFSDMLGDIVISVPRAEAQAEEYGHSFERELGFLFVHGFLHLLGYDHGDEEQERAMFAKQEEVLLEAGLTR